MRYLFSVAVFTGLTLDLVSGQGVVRGRVSDSNTREPLPGVYVIYGKDQGTVTDDFGYYEIHTGAGNHNIIFRFIGYRELTRNIDVDPGDTIFLDVFMQTELKEIGQIVVSANRTEQKISELTVSMDLIRAADFGRSHITDSRELINKTPGIEVLDGQASIRGGTGFSYGVGSRVLALIDGLPVLSPDAGSIKWQFLPLENISQIEIIKGASSVLYGSSALNGIINFRTAAATKDPDTRFHAEAGVYGNPSNKKWIWWDTPRIFSGVSFSHLQKEGNNDIGVGISLTDNNGYRKYNDEATGRVSLRFKHENEKKEGLEYGLNVNSGYTEKTDFVLWENSETGALKQDTSSVSNLKGSFIAIDPFLNLDNEGPLDHELRMRFQATSNKFPVRSANNSNAISLYGEYQANHTVSDFLRLIGGFAGNYSSILSNFHGDHKGINAAVFAQAEGNPADRLKLVTGIRIEYNSIDGTADRMQPVIRTGFNWQAAEFTYVRGSFGQGYRYPSVAEKFASTTLGAVRIFPSPDIESETGWSTEVGVRQGLMLWQFRGQADLSVFVSGNRNLIEYIFGYYPDQSSGIYDFGFRATNVEQSRIYGYELEFLMERSAGKMKANFGGGYTFIYPSEFNPENRVKTGNYLKYRRKHSLKLSGGIRCGNFETGLDIFYRSKILDIDDVFLNELTRERILPGFYDYWTSNNRGYFLADCNFRYMISEKFNLSLVVKNITNTEYMGRPGDIQAQRNFSLRFAGKF